MRINITQTCDNKTLFPYRLNTHKNSIRKRKGTFAKAQRVAGFLTTIKYHHWRKLFSLHHFSQIPLQKSERSLVPFSESLPHRSSYCLSSNIGHFWKSFPLHIHNQFPSLGAHKLGLFVHIFMLWIYQDCGLDGIFLIII